MLNVKKKKKKKPKIQDFKFHNSFNKFGRDCSWECTPILGSESGANFQNICRLKPLLLYSPLLTNIKAKVQILDHP